MLRWYQRESVDAMLPAKENGVIVAPTGSGKSHIIRSFVEESNERILVLSHVKEILEQDFNLLAGLDSIGLFSAGHNIRKHDARVVVGGVHSVVRNLQYFKNFDKILIDECHLVPSEDGMYNKIIETLDIPFIGLTATPYRLKDGYIYGDSGRFDKILYEAPVDKLTDEGFLCSLNYYGDKEEYDTSNIKTVAGDFSLSDMSLAYNRSAITEKIIRKIINIKRKHILIFCIDISHAEQVAKIMTEAGVTCKAVHSESPRDQSIQDFKAGKIQALANVNILTTGFDYPEVDMLVLMRPTKSLTLHMQMLGRGMRPHPSKKDTLVKDFAGNTKRLGTAINPAPIGAPKRGKGGANPFMKECPECNAIVHPAVRLCKCGYKFKFRHNLQTDSKTVTTREHKVINTYYAVHRKTNSPPSIKISYVCERGRIFNEWILLEHGGYAAHKSKYWISRRYSGKIPQTVKGFMEISNELLRPTFITVEEGNKYPKIVSSRFFDYQNQGKTNTHE